VAWTAPPSTYLSGNTAGTTYVHGHPVTLVGGANITVSGSGNQIVIKGGAGGAGGTGPSISAGTQSTDGGTVFFANSNGVTFGMANSSKITATVKTDYLTAQTAFVLSDSNGISWGTNGSTVTATVKTDYLTTARRSTDAIGLNTAKTNVTWTVNSSGLSFDAGGYAGTGTGATNATVSVDTAGVSVNVGPYITTARRSTDAIGLNTAQTAVTWTVNSSGLSIDAGAYLTTARRSTDAIGLNTAQTAVTWTVNSSGLSLDAGAYLTTARRSTDAVGLNTAQTAVTWTVNSSGISIDAGAYLTTARRSTDAIGLNTAQTNVTWTANSSGLSLNAAGYAGTVTGATNATLTVNSSGVSVSVDKHPSVSYWENPNIDGMTSWSGTSNSISIQRIYIPAQISATRADFLLNISGSSSGRSQLPGESRPLHGHAEHPQHRLDDFATLQLQQHFGSQLHGRLRAALVVDRSRNVEHDPGRVLPRP
jgi:hypothetical protein